MQPAVPEDERCLAPALRPRAEKVRQLTGPGRVWGSTGERKRAAPSRSIRRRMARKRGFLSTAISETRSGPLVIRSTARDLATAPAGAGGEFQHGRGRFSARTRLPPTDGNCRFSRASGEISNQRKQPKGSHWPTLPCGFLRCDPRHHEGAQASRHTQMLSTGMRALATAYMRSHRCKEPQSPGIWRAAASQFDTRRPQSLRRAASTQSSCILLTLFIGVRSPLRDLTEAPVNVTF